MDRKGRKREKRERGWEWRNGDKKRVKKGDCESQEKYDIRLGYNI